MKEEGRELSWGSLTCVPHSCLSYSALVAFNSRRRRRKSLNPAPSSCFWAGVIKSLNEPFRPYVNVCHRQRSGKFRKGFFPLDLLFLRLSSSGLPESLCEGVVVNLELGDLLILVGCDGDELALFEDIRPECRVREL